MSPSTQFTVGAVVLFIIQAQTSGEIELSSSTSEIQNHSTLLPKSMKWSRKLEDSCLKRLHKEIEDFYKFMTLTKEEQQDREEVLQRVNNTILGLWPTAEVRVFGSYNTGLSLPTSDIDLVVFGNWTEPPLNTLEEAIVNSTLSKHEQNTVLPNAQVPLIKINNEQCHIKIDITFNEDNGIKSSELIMKYQKQFPMLAKLVIVLKQLLLIHDLNDVFTGGISSYGLVLMTTNFLQLHPKQKEDTFGEVNLGGLLMEFLDFYGRKFNYNNTAIRVNDGGAFLPKEEVEKNLKSHECAILCLVDPIRENEDLGRNTHNAYKIKHVFKHAYLNLRETVKSPNCTARGKSILGKIVRVPDEVISYRSWVRDDSCRVVNSSFSIRASEILTLKLLIVVGILFRRMSVQ